MTLKIEYKGILYDVLGDRDENSPHGAAGTPEQMEDYMGDAVGVSMLWEQIKDTMSVARHDQG